MSTERFFKHPELPFAECRYSQNSERQFKPHMHKTFSIGAIDQGEVSYKIQDQIVTLKPGSLALINPETIHSCNPSESLKRSFYVLHLDVDWCLQRQNSLWQEKAFCPVSDPVLDDPLIFHQFIHTMDWLMDGEALKPKEQQLNDLVENIFLMSCNPKSVIVEPTGDIEALRQQLSNDLNAELSLKELAAMLKTNPYTLLRRFKAGTGVTPHAYRLNCRIELARKLLREGQELSWVALECGFFDQSHFHRHFKSITTVTPREYQVNFIQ